MKCPSTSRSVNPGKDKPTYEPQEGESGVSSGNPAENSDAIGRDGVAAGGDDETGAASGEDEETDDAGVDFDYMYDIEPTCEIAPWLLRTDQWANIMSWY